MQSNKHLKLLMKLVKVNAVVNRRFSVQGLGLSDLLVLYYLHEAPEQKLRPVDLAEKLGLTASGVTRLLLPMEKIGLVKRTTEKTDARISYAALAPSGKRKFEDALEDSELLSQELITASKMDLMEIVKLVQ